MTSPAKTSLFPAIPSNNPDAVKLTTKDKSRTSAAAKKTIESSAPSSKAQAQLISQKKVTNESDKQTESAGSLPSVVVKKVATCYAREAYRQFERGVLYESVRDVYKAWKFFHHAIYYQKKAEQNDEPRFKNKNGVWVTKKSYVSAERKLRLKYSFLEAQKIPTFLD